MDKIKTIYMALALITLIILGILASVPELIPSLEIVQLIFVFIVYILIIAVAYAIILRLRNYFCQKYSIDKGFMLTRLSAAAIIFVLFASFIISSINIGKDAFNGMFTNELYFPVQKVRLYVYEESLDQPMTLIKIKDKTWPFVRDLSFIENCRPADLKSWRHNDTVVFLSPNVELKVDLISRKVMKKYSHHVVLTNTGR
jgi:hypothetical protein